MHAGRGVSREFEPLRLQRVELGVNHGAWEGDDSPFAAVGAADGQAGLAVFADGGGQPFGRGIERRLAHGSGAKINDASFGQGFEIEPPNRRVPNEKDVSTVPVNGG